ncbi:MAG: SpoIIE family protein phosphatase [Bacteroidetes bacterium]|nr:SpoIIE family protein phosphatase [Bacteroidota bacterium]
MIDSINYAKRLQTAILATRDDINKAIPNNFLFYQPKDIVAGDFYFFETTDTHIFYAAADCTGHGVPGALVSVVCSDILSRCVLEFKLTDPAKILDKTRELVLATFAKSNSDVKDGMDISFISINKITKEIKWSGANNPLWYIT